MQIKEKLALFTGKTGGIDSWLTSNRVELVWNRLEQLREQPISLSAFNQLLALSHQPGMSAGFYDYYWCSVPSHTYNLKSLPSFDETYDQCEQILSADQLAWGLYRLYLDSLLYFGSIKNGYYTLRQLGQDDLTDLFSSKRIDTESLIHRGPPLPLQPIGQDDRYLIAEQACKSFEPVGGEEIGLWYALSGAWIQHEQESGKRQTTAKELLDLACIKPQFADRQGQFSFAVDEILEEPIASEQDLKEKFNYLQGKFSTARKAALANTELYLSMANDLDVYVATSMRNRQQFRDMAKTCEMVFGSEQLEAFNLRYFDPTLSAARGHEDKGLLECLMVKCAKVLVYTAGLTDSFGKDVEAAMALSLGKPVIFFCEGVDRRKFFKEIHPLSRLIEFSTGVAVGVMVAESVQEVITLLSRIFENNMEYELTHPQEGHFRVVERLTNSTVRVQTNDELLRETFWNCYHGPRDQTDELD